MKSKFIVSCIALSVCCCSPAYEYYLHELPPTSSDGSCSNDINDQNVAVGYSGLTASMWPSPTSYLSLGTLGGSMSEAYGINNGNVVVGASYTLADIKRRAFRWSSTNGMTDLGTLGGTDSAAYGINDKGEIVGQASRSGSNMDRAFIWSEAEGMRSIGTLGGNYSVAETLNESSQVVGTSLLSDNKSMVAFIWTSSGGMKSLGTLGGPNSGATDINESGQVVGYSNLTGSLNGAFLWQESTGMVNLGSLGYDASATSINDSGIIVGESTTLSGVDHAFVYKNGLMSDLNDLVEVPSGVNLMWAYDVNNNGWITVWAEVQDGSNTRLKAYLLEPVPEPFSLIGVTVGLASMRRFRRRKN